MPEPADTIRRVNSGEPMALEELYRARATLDSFSGNRDIDREEARRKVGAVIDDLEGPRPVATASKTGTTLSGRPNASTQIICPHCQTRGQVRTKPARAEKGVSGGTGAGDRCYAAGARAQVVAGHGARVAA